jgi:hypothetical protein
MMLTIGRDVLKNLKSWKKEAEQIPNYKLHKQYQSIKHQKIK